ncbi:MAG TPA: polyhydroxyalkanoate synthesis regulator DNA-binding domain-containing protein [Candidatus Dormibacteraeota bacterium]
MAEKHLIKKYANRKLYDTNTSRYITLNGISELVREGYDIEVVDRESGADLTPLILSQIVMGEQKRGGGARDNGDSPSTDRGSALLDYVRRTLNVPAQLVGNEMGRRKGDVEDLIESAIERALAQLSLPSRREVERLSERVEALARRVDRATGGGTTRTRAARKPARRSRTRKAAAQRST